MRYLHEPNTCSHCNKIYEEFVIFIKLCHFVLNKGKRYNGREKNVQYGKVKDSLNPNKSNKPKPLADTLPAFFLTLFR
jgi:hypothetical protein